MTDYGITWTPEEPDLYKIEFEEAIVMSESGDLRIELPLPRGTFRVRVIVETDEEPQD
jgi:hypothetical protein